MVVVYLESAVSADVQPIAHLSGRNLSEVAVTTYPVPLVTERDAPRTQKAASGRFFINHL